MPSTDTGILKHVKAAMLISGTSQDAALQAYIDEVTAYLSAAGVSETLLADPVSVGVITRGVIDLWNYGAGEARLSDYFMQRAIQLAATEEVPDADV